MLAPAEVVRRRGHPAKLYSSCSNQHAAIFQKLTIKDLNAASAVLDETTLLHCPSNHRHGRSPCAKHLGKELLS